MLLDGISSEEGTGQVKTYNFLGGDLKKTSFSVGTFIHVLRIKCSVVP